MLSPPSAHKLSEKFAVNIVGHDVASSRVPTPNIPPPPPVRYHTCTSLDLDDYFVGPRDMHKHSKLPYFMRVHGSVLPKMLLPLSFVVGWTTGVTCVNRYVQPLAARNLARLIWLHVVERDDPEHPEYAKRYLLSKISAIQLINAFCIALKRRLRFGPAVDYPDLRNLVVHLEGTMASRADQDALKQQNPSAMKRFGNNLGVTIAASNPRKLIKRSTDNLGNLPHEMLSHLTAYLESIIQGQDAMPTLCCQNLAFTDVRIMADILTGCERILNTPLPLAYSISISQITWVYIMVLPFQLVVKLGWTTIPATMVAAYIILGLAMISQEVENPFGNDVSDLPMDAYCTEIGADLDVLTSVPMVEYKKFTCSPENRPLYPLSHGTVTEWEQRTIEEIRTALRAKTGNVSNNISIDKFE